MAVHTFASGEVVTAANLNTLATGAWVAWTAYTPGVTASVTNPSSWGDQSGRFLQIGKNMFWEVYLQSHVGMSVGSGVYSIALPNSTANDGRTKRHVGSGGFTTDNSSVFMPAACVVESAGGSTFTVWLSSSSHKMANTDWGSDAVHYFIASGCYELA